MVPSIVTVAPSSPVVPGNRTLPMSTLLQSGMLLSDRWSKFAAASPGFIRIAAERANLTPEEVELVIEEHEKASQVQQEARRELRKASKPLPGSNPGANGSKPGGSKKPAGKTAQKPAAKKPAK